MNKRDYLPYLPASVVLLFPYWSYAHQQICNGFGFLPMGRSFVWKDWGDGTNYCEYGAKIDMPMMGVCLMVACIVGVLIKKHLSQAEES